MGPIRGYVLATAMASATTVVVALIDHLIHVPNISLLYVPPILLTAIYFGTGPSLWGAGLSVVEYDFFLVAPAFTLTVNRIEDVLALVVFCSVAVIASQLAVSVRSRAEAAQWRARESRTLYELGQALMFARDIGEVLTRISREVTRTFDAVSCAIYVPKDGESLEVAAGSGSYDPEDREANAAAAYAYSKGSEVSMPGRRSRLSTRSGPAEYVPLRAADQVVGVMGLKLKPSSEGMSAAEHGLLNSVAAQAAVSIARAQTEEQRRRLEILEEEDRLKSALISSVSHDLRTPLASIKASATSLLLADKAWPPEEQRELLTAIDSESDRLNRLVGNLLDMSRIESGALHPRLDWYDVNEVVDAALAQAKPVLAGRIVTTRLSEGPSLVLLDLTLVAQAVANLVDNAARYTDTHVPLEVEARLAGGRLCLAVVDHGSGVPFDQRDRIFKRFSRTSRNGESGPGVGLGLAICRGIAEAHEGTIRLLPTPGGGSTFVLDLPQPSTVAGAGNHRGQPA